jgi:hypothetical protein
MRGDVPKIDSPLDFRQKRANAERLESLAEKYSMENNAMVQAQRLKEKRAANLQASMGEDGIPNLDIFIGLSGSDGDGEAVNLAMKTKMEQQKAQVEQRKAEMEEVEQTYEIMRTPILRAYDNPTWESIGEIRDLSNRYSERISPKFKIVAESADTFLRDPNNNNPEKIKDFLAQSLKPEDIKEKEDKIIKLDTGDEITFRKESELEGQTFKKKPAPTAGGSGKSLAERKFEYQQRKDVKEEERRLKKERLANDKKIRKEADKKYAKFQKGKNAISAAIEMHDIVERNPGAITGIFADLIAGIHKVKATVMPKTTGAGDLAVFEAKAATVAAMAVDLLSGGGRLASKFGQERLEKVAGAARAGGAQATLDLVDVAVSIISEEAGVPMPEEFRQRLSQKKGYNEQGYYVGEGYENTGKVPKMTTEELKSKMQKYGIK